MGFSTPKKNTTVNDHLPFFPRASKPQKNPKVFQAVRGDHGGFGNMELGNANATPPPLRDNDGLISWVSWPLVGLAIGWVGNRIPIEKKGTLNVAVRI